jgi:hypothetical protein
MKNCQTQKNSKTLKLPPMKLPTTTLLRKKHQPNRLPLSKQKLERLESARARRMVPLLFPCLPSAQARPPSLFTKRLPFLFQAKHPPRKRAQRSARRARRKQALKNPRRRRLESPRALMTPQRLYLPPKRKRRRRSARTKASTESLQADSFMHSGSHIARLSNSFLDLLRPNTSFQMHLWDSYERVNDGSISCHFSLLRSSQSSLGLGFRFWFVLFPLMIRRTIFHCFTIGSI